MTLYGPTFGSELNAAGLAGLPIVWSEDEIHGRDDLTPEQDAALQVVIDAHDPDAPDPRTVDAHTFYQGLVAQDLYTDFKAWVAGQPDSTQVYFDKSSHFREDDTKVAAAMTALSTTPVLFFTAALTPP